MIEGRWQEGSGRRRWRKVKHQPVAVVSFREYAEKNWSSDPMAGRSWSDREGGTRQPRRLGFGLLRFAAGREEETLRRGWDLNPDSIRQL